MITHRLNYDAYANVPTAEAAAMAFVRAFNDVPDGVLDEWALSSNHIQANRWNALLTARRAMARDGLV